MLLFYKESLTNIIRHSGATKVTTDLRANDKRINLCVTDNGHGRSDSEKQCGFPDRFADGLDFSAHRYPHNKPQEGGTRIELIVPTRQPWYSHFFGMEECMNDPIRVMLVEDNLEYRGVVELALENEPDIETGQSVWNR